MRASTWATLGIATVIVVAGSGYAVWQRQQSTAASAVGGPLLPQLATRLNDVAAIAVQGSKGDFRIVRGAGDTWALWSAWPSCARSSRAPGIPNSTTASVWANRARTRTPCA